MAGAGGNKAKPALDQAAKVFNQSGFAKQLVAGTASGWLTGILLRHSGKNLALLTGTGIIVHQIAFHKGLIKQDLDALKQIAQRKTNDITKNSPALKKVQVFATKNKVFTAGFVGGLLIGIAF